MQKVLRATTSLLPVLIIFFLAYQTFISSAEALSGASLFASLMVFYPILFLLQGVASSLFRANVFVSLALSIAAYLVVLFIWMNSSAIIYIFAYLLIGSLGYGVTHLIKKAIGTGGISRNER